MGMDFCSDSGRCFSISAIGWGNFFDIALENGWAPRGTEKGPPPLFPAGLEWEGGYFTNDFQYVTPQDAAAMADAIQLHIDNNPEKKLVDDPFDNGRPSPLIEFVDFLRGGGFTIG